MAMEIRSAEEILLIPGLQIRRRIARLTRGMPQITTVIHAGSAGRWIPMRGRKKRKASHSPPISVAAVPESISLIFFNILAPPFWNRSWLLPRSLAAGKFNFTCSRAWLCFILQSTLSAVGLDCVRGTGRLPHRPGTAQIQRYFTLDRERQIPYNIFDNKQSV